MKTLFALTLAGALAVSGLALAQSSHHGSNKAASGDSAATKAYRAANDKMHKAMDLKYTNDADVDFIRGMIPHHQGAIDMAKVVLEHGKDEKARKWATDIIREQEREIGEMREWLNARKK
jgi:uncharacterized protein (DUF305 family)